MGQFLDYIRIENVKLLGKASDLLKRVKTKNETLDYDSVSNITDLSKEDIFTTTMQVLTTKEQEKLAADNRKWRKSKTRAIPRHNCLNDQPRKKKADVNNSRFVVKMELRAKSEPKEYTEEEISAHQFSARDMSV